jgi:hypothetical protein
LDRIAVSNEAIQVAQEAIQVAQETVAAASGAAFSVTYTFPLIDLDGGDVVRDIQGPAGLRGTVQEVNIFDCSETFTVVTTDARLDIGIQGGDDNAYAITDDVGALAADAAISLPLTAGVVGTIPAAEDLLLTFVAPTGGTPEGIATWAVTINWFV